MWIQIGRSLLDFDTRDFQEASKRFPRGFLEDSADKISVPDIKYPRNDNTFLQRNMWTSFLLTEKNLSSF